MKTFALLAAGALALAACAETSAPDAGATDASLGSAGAAGPEFCETAPQADPVAMERWNELCFPDNP